MLSRTRLFKPSSLIVAARSLATTPGTINSSADVLAGPSSTTAVEDVPVEPLPRSSKDTVTARQQRRSLPLTPPPTPYHAFVHLPLLNFNNAAPTTRTTEEPMLVPLPSPLFNVPSRPSLLHKLVIAHLSSLRAGTAASKNRSQVAFSGRKIKPQKGTGGARLGSKGSPMLKGGGHAFGIRPKGPDGWLRKVNRKEERLGLRVALSDKWRTGNLCVVDRLALPETSTRQLRQRLGSRGWLDALFLVGDGTGGLARDGHQVAFELASGNLPEVAVVRDVDELGVYDIVKRRKVVVELEALDELVRRLDPDVANELEMDALAQEMQESHLDFDEEPSLVAGGGAAAASAAAATATAFA